MEERCGSVDGGEGYGGKGEGEGLEGGGGGGLWGGVVNGGPDVMTYVKGVSCSCLSFDGHSRWIHT